jgi:hypothetical protein
MAIKESKNINIEFNIPIHVKNNPLRRNKWLGQLKLTLSLIVYLPL